MIVGSSTPASLCFKVFSKALWLTLSLLIYTCKSLVILTDRFETFVVFPFAFGKIRSNASGVMAGEVSMKKINNRKTISVIELMLKSALTLFLLLKFILSRFV